jgi:hypothetical protein
MALVALAGGTQDATCLRTLGTEEPARDVRVAAATGKAAGAASRLTDSEPAIG